MKYKCEVCEGVGKSFWLYCTNCNGTGKVDWIRNIIRKSSIPHVLAWACNNGNLDKVKSLVEQDANMQAGKNSALRYSATYGYLEVVKFLVEQGADIHTHHDGPLRYATHNGHLEVVKFLVEHDANIHTLMYKDICTIRINHLKIKN